MGVEHGLGGARADRPAALDESEHSPDVAVVKDRREGRHVLALVGRKAAQNAELRGAKQLVVGMLPGMP
jgi:hypothetical protein